MLVTVLPRLLIFNEAERTSAGVRCATSAGRHAAGEMNQGNRSTMTGIEGVGGQWGVAQSPISWRSVVLYARLPKVAPLPGRGANQMQSVRDLEKLLLPCNPAAQRIQFAVSLCVAGGRLVQGGQPAISRFPSSRIPAQFMKKERNK